MGRIARAAVAFGAVFVGVGDALAAAAPSGNVPKGVPPEMTPVLAKARLLITSPVGNGFFAHVWDSPSLRGGTCRFATLDHNAAAPKHPTFPNGGMSCSIGPPQPLPERLTETHPLRYSVSVATRHQTGNLANWVPPFVYGEIVSSRLHAARIVVRWKGGSHRLVLRGRYFAGGSPALYSHLPFTLVAYDAAGREVARGPT
jgi:hypothetical protein